MSRILEIKMTDGRKLLDHVSMDDRIEAVVARQRARSFRLLPDVLDVDVRRIPIDHIKSAYNWVEKNPHVEWQTHNIRGKSVISADDWRVGKELTLYVSSLGTICDGWGGYVDEGGIFVSYIPDKEWGFKHYEFLFRPKSGELERIGYKEPAIPRRRKSIPALTRLPFFADRLLGI